MAEASSAAEGDPPAQYTEADLRKIFLHYTSPNFNKPAHQFAPTGKLPAGGSWLDSSRFNKICRESGLLDGKNVKPQDVDVLFSKAIRKSKNEGKDNGGKKCDWAGFKWAMEQLGEMRFPPKAAKKAPEGEEQKEGEAAEAEGPSAYQQTIDLLCDKLLSGVKITTDQKAPAPSTPKSPTSASPTSPGTGGRSIFDRLTDTSLYTGTHRERFDAEGKGRGAAGRDAPSQTHSLDQILNRKPATVTGVPVKAYQATDLSQKAKLEAEKERRRKVAERAAGSTSPTSTTTSDSLSLPGSPGARPAARKMSSTSLGSSGGGSGTSSPPPRSPGGGTPGITETKTDTGIFARLTDPRNYHATHRERFDLATGQGKGIAGRREEAPKKFRQPD